MKLMTLKQYMKLSKPALIRKITKSLRAMPKKKLAVLCYNITKSKLPRLKVTKRIALYDPSGMGWTVKAARKRISKKKKAGIYEASNGRKYRILASGKSRFI